MDVFENALKENVAVLPGSPFYIDGGGMNTVRLNFSNSTDEKIITGIGRLAKVIRRLCTNSASTSISKSYDAGKKSCEVCRASAKRTVPGNEGDRNDSFFEPGKKC
jgi:hypothetical protein